MSQSTQWRSWRGLQTICRKIILIYQWGSRRGNFQSKAQLFYKSKTQYDSIHINTHDTAISVSNIPDSFGIADYTWDDCSAIGNQSSYSQ